MIGRIVITSLGINATVVGPCGDELAVVPTGNEVCYWNDTAGSDGFYRFAGSTTGPLAALSRVAAGAMFTWTAGGKSYTRTLTGISVTFPLGTGWDVPPGQPAYLELRTATTIIEYIGCTHISTAAYAATGRSTVWLAAASPSC